MKGKGINTMWLVLISISFLALTIGAGIGVWGKNYVNKQEEIAAAELQARKDVVEVNSQLGDGKTFTVSSFGKDYRIIRFTAGKDYEVLDKLATRIISDNELLRLLKKVGFREVQISSEDQTTILCIDLITDTMSKKSNI